MTSPITTSYTAGLVALSPDLDGGSVIGYVRPTPNGGDCVEMAAERPAAWFRADGAPIPTKHWNGKMNIGRSLSPRTHR